MSEIIKSGNLFKFSDTVFNTKWKYNYVELLRNSNIRWFENKGDKAPKRSIILKDVRSFLAFGDIIKQLPFKPDVKEDQINFLIAIPHDNNRNTRLSFFLCNNQTEMQEWVDAILSTVSDQNNSQAAPPIQAQTNVPTNSYPPTSNPAMTGSYNNYPGGPPSTGGNYSGGPPNPGGNYSGGPPNPGGNYSGGPPNPGGNYPGGPYPVSQQNMAGGYQSAPPASYGGSGSGPPPIGFNIGGAPMATYQPPAPQTYSYPSVQQNPPASYPTSYQAGYNPQYPVQARPYAPGNAPVQYGGQVSGQPPQTFVIVDGKKKKKKYKLKNAAIGLAAGAAGAYATHKLFHGFGHGWGGGWGGGHHDYYVGHHGGYYGGGWGGHHGSWSSLSSYDSWSD